MIDDAATKQINAFKLLQLLFLTLIFGVLLNSSHFYVRASSWDESATRTGVMTVLKPFAKVSDLIGLNKVRSKSREAIGLTRDDKIDTFQFKTTKEIDPALLTTTTLPTLSESNKLPTWIIGDSLAATPGESLLAQLPSSAFEIQGLDSKVSTGLARPDVFNWFTYINEFVPSRHPKTVIITFGANDDQSLFSDGGNIGPFGSDAWKAEYSRRVNSTLDFLGASGVYALWVEIPPVRDGARNDRYAIINEITRDAVSKHKNASSYIETKAAFTTPDGQYSDSLDINGTLTLVRAADGIHFTRAGGDIIARLIIEKLHTLYVFS